MKTAELRRLSNGLSVVLAPCEAESVAFGLFVASGSRHESPRTAGISHFIEHMLFKGTPTRRPLDITREIEGRGGNFNAYTGEESTCYYAHLPNEYLAEAVEILSDMYLNATFPEEEFAREKDVVLEEIKMYADDPDSVVLENLQSSLFPGSGIGRPVAGSVRSLTPLTAADLRAYRNAHYLPRRTIAVVVGAFDPERAVELISRAFSSVRKGRDFRTSPTDLTRPPVPEVTVSRQDISQAQLALGYRIGGLCLDDERRFAVTVLDGILGRGMSSRLFQEVREKRGLSYDISSRANFFSDAGFFSVAAGVDPSKIERTRVTIMRELERVKTTRVSRAELSRIKEFLIGNFRLSHEKVTSKLFYYGQTALLYRRLISPAEQIDALRKVSSEEVLQVARSVFREENLSVSKVLPKD